MRQAGGRPREGRGGSAGCVPSREAGGLVSQQGPALGASRSDVAWSQAAG